MNAEWKWDFAFQILPQMLWATLNTDNYRSAFWDLSFRGL